MFKPLFIEWFSFIEFIFYYYIKEKKYFSIKIKKNTFIKLFIQTLLTVSVIKFAKYDKISCT